MTKDFRESYSVSYDKAKDILFLRWFKVSKDIDEEDFYQSQKDYQRSILKHKPRNTIIDLREMKFIVRPALQEKIAMEHFPDAIAAGLTRVAILNTTEFVTRIWAEQFMEEDETGTFMTRYYDNEEDALKWLASK
jgi:hypothetical protein